MSLNTSPVSSPGTGDSRDSFLPLLLAPLARTLPLLAFLIVTGAQLAGVFAVLRDPLFRATVIGGLAVCLPLRLAAQLVGDQHPALILLAHLAAGAYFAILSVVVLVRVITHPRVTKQTVIGSVCGYLLIGSVFTFAYLIRV